MNEKRTDEKSLLKKLNESGFWKSIVVLVICILAGLFLFL